MKKLTIILLCVSTFVCAENVQEKVKSKHTKKSAQKIISQKQKAAQTYLLDTIDSVIYSLEGTELITHSETLLPSLQGGSRDLNNMIFETLVYFDAKKHKIEPNEDAVDRYLVKIMQENNLKREDLETIFSQGGRTYKQGREELKHVQAVNGMIDFKIRSNMIVPRKDVEAWHTAHPQIEPAHYQLQYADINLNADARDADYNQLYEKLKKFSKAGIGFEVNWGEPDWFEKDDIAKNIQFIVSMQEGEISKPIKINNGFRIYRMVKRQEKNERSLDPQRYREIVEILLQPMYKKLLAEYRTHLFEHASIVRFK